MVAGPERVWENISRLTAMDLPTRAAVGTNEINAARGWHLGESAKRLTALQRQAIPLPDQHSEFVSGRGQRLRQCVGSGGLAAADIKIGHLSDSPMSVKDPKGNSKRHLSRS